MILRLLINLLTPDPKTEIMRPLLLRAVRDLQPNAYGVPLHRRLCAETRRDVTFGKMYCVLDAMEAEGLVYSIMGDPTPERGMRAKCFFFLTENGAKVLESEDKSDVAH